MTEENAQNKIDPNAESNEGTASSKEQKTDAQPGQEAAKQAAADQPGRAESQSPPPSPPPRAAAAPEEDGEDIEKVKVIAALAYLIFFLPLLTHPQSQFGKFHANQALLLLIIMLAVNLVGGIIPFIGWFVILPLGYLFCLVLLVMGIVNAINGKKQRLPLIGEFDIIK